MQELKPDEVALSGNWVRRPDGTMSHDDSEARIDWLLRNRLEELASDPSAWTTLYRDPRDGRLWELSYPQSEMHGGGPRRLELLDAEHAAKRYNLAKGESA